MKKFLKFLGVIPLAATMMVGLTGCFGGNDNNNNNNNNNNNQEPPHEHIYSNSYTYDNTYHWHEPLCDDITEVSGKEEHILVRQVLREPTCSYEGIEIYSCASCNYRTEKLSINKLNHKYKTSWTCYDGTHAHTCETCGKARADEASHTLVDGKCSECGYTDGYKDFTGWHTTDSTGSYFKITGIKDSTLENIVIPSHIGGDPVRVIEREAFKDNKNLKSITLSDNIESIDYRAFYGCSNLETVVFGKNIKQIGVGAFNRCDKLQSVKLSEGLTYLGASAFEGCNGLEEVELPSTLKKIESNTFMFCSSLTNLTLPDGLEEMESMLYNCNSLSYNEYSNGYYLGSKTNPYLVLVKQLNDDIANITINSDCKFIYYSALNECTNLTEVVIPQNVKTIYRGAISNCENLTNLSVSANNQFYTSENNIIYNKDKTVLIRAASKIDNVVVPAGVTEIGEGAFQNSSIRYINLVDCTTLKTIGKNAFNGSSIQTIELNNGLTEIGEYAFYSCQNLTSVKIPSSVTSIAYSAFNYCNRLTNIDFAGTKEQWNKLVGNGTSWYPTENIFTVKCSTGEIRYNDETDA